MAAPQNFRSAFNGFNREDVVHYIEYINTQHTAQVNQLVSEAEFLRQKMAHMQSEQPSGDVVAELNAQLEALRQELQQKDAAYGELQAKYEALEKAPKVQHVSIEAELEAYRRAERTERLARERVEQLYHQANGTIADAAVKVEDASARIADLAEKTVQQLAQLQEAVSGSKEALADAKASLYAIRPEENERP